jgi:transposase-like protein
MPPRGPKSTLTPEVRALIMSIAKRGVSTALVAEASGVPFNTLNQWIYKSRHGKTDDPALLGFAAEYDQARGIAAVGAVDVIHEASHEQRDWRAAAWFLERTRGEEFGSKLYLERAREQVLDDIIERLRSGLDPGVFAQVCEILSSVEVPDGARYPARDAGNILEAELVRTDT